jgi:hypothetical protein
MNALNWMTGRSEKKVTMTNPNSLFAATDDRRNTAWASFTAHTIVSTLDCLRETKASFAVTSLHRGLVLEREIESIPRSFHDEERNVQLRRRG